MCCTSCGSPIPDGQGNSCSMCYGDPYHGRDGYYLQFLEEQEERWAQEREWERQMEADPRWPEEQSTEAQPVDNDLPF